MSCWAEGVPLATVTICIKSTGACDVSGACLSASGWSLGDVPASLLEIRVSDTAGVEPTCETELGETAATLKGKAESLCFPGLLMGWPRTPEYAHPSCFDLTTGGCLAHEICC